MDSKQGFRIYNFLYRTLRYPSAGIKSRFEDGGWLAIGELMHLCSKSHTDFKISRDELAEIIVQDAGLRFELDESGSRIRAKKDDAETA